MYWLHRGTRKSHTAIIHFDGDSSSSSFFVFSHGLFLLIQFYDLLLFLQRSGASECIGIS